MAVTHYAGTDGLVTIGSEDQTLSDWTLEVDAAVFDATYLGQTFRKRLTGLKGGKITGKGPYDVTNTKLIAGTSATFLLQVGSTYVFSVPAVISRVKYSQDIEKGAMIDIEAQSNGTFDIDLSTP